MIEARRSNSEHMAEEERQGLADFRRHADPVLRHELGVRFAVYESGDVEGVEAHDRDPQEYLDDHS